MKIFLVITMMCLLSGCGASAKWPVGSTVCFKQNGKKATVRWWYSGRPPTNNVPLYTVVSVNDLNQVYEVDVLETDLQECPPN